MFRMVRKLVNPFNRTALVMMAWTHRRTMMRWGRSFWTELRSPQKIEPKRLALMGKVLWSITRDEKLAKARQLRQVRLDGDTVVVDTAPNWKGTARLVDELSDIDGVASVIDQRGNRLVG